MMGVRIIARLIISIMYDECGYDIIVLENAKRDLSCIYSYVYGAII